MKITELPVGYLWFITEEGRYEPAHHVREGDPLVHILGYDDVLDDSDLERMRWSYVKPIKTPDQSEVCFVVSPYQTVESSVIFNDFSVAEAYLLGLIISSKYASDGHKREFKMYWRSVNQSFPVYMGCVKYSGHLTNKTADGVDLVIKRFSSAFGLSVKTHVHLVTSLGELK
jgi:hypothetical protein